MVKTRVPALGVLLAMTLLVPAAALSAVYHVPDEHPTIAAALSAAGAGDEVHVRPGVYYESGLVLREGILLTGTGDTPEDTVIDARGQASILRCTSVGLESEIRNFTLRNGYANGESSYDRSGGAVYINQATVTISDCVFTGNIAPSHGGAVRCIQASPLILNCRFSNNTALVGGGGALDCSYNASPVVRECVFEDNQASWGGAVACRGESDASIVGSHFYGNRTGQNDAPGGAALAFYDSRPQFELCTFYGNRSARGGAVAALPDSPLQLDWCTIVGNEANEGGGIYTDSADVRITGSIGVFQAGTGLTAVGDAAPVIRCSNFHGNSSGDFAGLSESPVGRNGNLSVDPVFCASSPDAVTGFNLDAASPCAETPECGTLGAWAADCSGDRGLQPLPQMPVVLAISNVGAAPNPFNPATRIRFELESEQQVRIEVYGIDGRRVCVLADQVFTPGRNEVEWRGADDSGRRAGSGLYIVRLQGEAETHTQKITLLK